MASSISFFNSFLATMLKGVDFDSDTIRLALLTSGYTYDATDDTYADVLAKSTAEQQTLYLGGATGGTFTLGDGETDTDPIAYDASAATIEAALEAIYGEGLVTVAADTDFTITFATTVGASSLEASFASLTGATSPALTEDQAFVSVELPDGDGYTVGGEALASLAISEISGPAGKLDAADVTWSALTAVFRAGLLYIDGEIGGVTDPLIAYILFDTTPADITVSGVDWTVQWSANGIFKVS
jgi:hypothetical protein